MVIVFVNKTNSEFAIQ